MNYYRGAVLILDSTIMAIGFNEDPRNIQRIKRKDIGSMAFSTLLAAIDVILTAIYLSKMSNGNKRIEISNEVFSLLPDILGFMRHINLKTALGLAAIDLVAAVITTGLGGKLLADDVAEFKKSAAGRLKS